MAPGPLPVWLLYMQALAIPAIAAIGAWIAWQQVGIARAKLQHDLYDKRFAVFDAARDLLLEIMLDGKSTPETLRAYALATANAAFVLDDELSRYVDEIRQRAFKLRITQASIEKASDNDRGRLVDKEAEETDWLLAQPPFLIERFKPFLRLGSNP
jgi:hypothetical protein